MYFDKTNKLLDIYAPLKRINKYKPKFKSKPWITLGLQKSISVENKLITNFINNFIQQSLNNFIQQSLNSGSVQVQILPAACRRFAMVRISNNGPGWK